MSILDDSGFALLDLNQDQLVELAKIRREEKAWGVCPPTEPTQLAAWLEWVDQPRMFADVVCNNWHDNIIEAAVYDPETGKSVWGSGVEDCIECGCPVTVGRYFVSTKVELSERKP
jgi:hypothetical protein